MHDSHPPSPRTTVRRLPARGAYDSAILHAILDEGLVAHVGIAVEGQPFVIPMAYARDGDRLLLHGSPASRLLRGLGEGTPVCVAVTLLDGLVLAKAPFSHSMNYRSVVVVGRARRIDDLEERRAALRALTEQLVPGRSAEVRASTDQEVRATEVLAIDLEEASAKVRTGPPGELKRDRGAEVWSGVLPLELSAGAPQPADDARGLEPPQSVRGYRRPTARRPPAR